MLGTINNKRYIKYINKETGKNLKLLTKYIPDMNTYSMSMSNNVSMISSNSSSDN